MFTATTGRTYNLSVHCDVLRYKNGRVGGRITFFELSLEADAPSCGSADR